MARDEIDEAARFIADHINLTGLNPCIGENDPLIGPRFFDMSRAYDKGLGAAAARAAAELGTVLREGVYSWFAGPGRQGDGPGRRASSAQSAANLDSAAARSSLGELPS